MHDGGIVRARLAPERVSGRVRIMKHLELDA